MSETKNLCRLCAVQKDSFIGIYDEEGHKLCLESKIIRCLQIELNPKDILPKAICLDCCAKLNQCSDFFETSSQAQSKLNLIFPITKKEEIEDDPDPEISDHDNMHQDLDLPLDEDHDQEQIQEQEQDQDLDLDDQDQDDHESSSSLEEESNLDRGPPGYVECVLSDSQGTTSSQTSKRKRRVPVRCAQLKSKGLRSSVKEETRKPRKVAKPEEMSPQEADPALANPRKRRDGWEKYPWMCTDCSEELPSMQALRTHHQVAHNQSARFMCAQCSKVYTKYYGFVSHVRRHRNYMKFCCEECGKCFSNKKVLESHRATHSDARPFVCTECGKSFRQQSALYVHNRSHQPDSVKNKYPCDQCDKRFSTKPNLVTHKRIHTGIRNFTCDQCGKSFIQKGNLDAHLLTHSSDKPHACPICNKAFKTPLQLRKHHTVHTGAKPHQCDVCGRQFRERGTLREHHRIHTGAMPFTCEFCGKSFRFKGILTTHRRQHTGERPYSCLECQHHFTNWPNYNKHMKRRHGINTSHQPDPNKIAAANHTVVPVLASVDTLGPSDSSHDLYDEERDRNSHFYNPAPPMGHYVGAPMPPAMLGFYNIPQLQNLDPATTMDMLHSVQHR